MMLNEIINCILLRLNKIHLIFQSFLKKDEHVSKKSRFTKVYKEYSKCNIKNRKNLDKLKRILIRNDIHADPIRIKKNIPFTQIDGWFILDINFRAFFPINTFKEIKNDPNEFKNSINFYLKQGWFFPPFLNKNLFMQLSKSIDQFDDLSKLIQIESIVLTIYNDNYLAIAYSEIYSKVPYVHYKKSEILEAIKAFICGFTYVGITALLPTIESIIRDLSDIQGEISSDVGKNKLLNIIDKILKDFIVESELNKFDFIPQDFLSRDYFNHFHEQYQMIYAFRSFIEDTLYIESKLSKDPGKLNRHAILHGFHGIYNYPFNFLRLISTIDMLAFIINIKTNTGSLLFPDTTTESKNYEEYFKLLRNSIPNFKKTSE